MRNIAVTNVLVLSHGYVGTFSSLYGTVQVWDVLTFEMGYTTFVFVNPSLTKTTETASDTL